MQPLFEFQSFLYLLLFILSYGEELPFRNSRCDVLEEREVHPSLRKDNGFLTLVKSCNRSSETCFDKKRARCLCEDETQAAFCNKDSCSCGMASNTYDFEHGTDNCSLSPSKMDKDHKINCIDSFGFMHNKKSYFGMTLPDNFQQEEQEIDALLSWLQKPQLSIPLSSGSVLPLPSGSLMDEDLLFYFALQFLPSDGIPSWLIWHENFHLEALFGHDLLPYGGFYDSHRFNAFYYFEPEIGNVEHMKRALGLPNTLSSPPAHPKPSSEVLRSRNVGNKSLDTEDEDLIKILSSLHKIYTIYGKNISYEKADTYEDCFLDCRVFIPLFPTTDTKESNTTEDVTEDINDFLKSEWPNDHSSLQVIRYFLYLGGALAKHILVFIRNEEFLGMVQLNFSNEVSSYVSYQRYLNESNDLVFKIKIFDRNWKEIKFSQEGREEEDPETDSDEQVALPHSYQEMVRSLRSVHDLPHPNPDPITLFCDKSLSVYKAIEKYEFGNFFLKGPHASDDLDSFSGSLLGWLENPSQSLLDYFHGLVGSWTYVVDSEKGIHSLAVMKDYESAYKTAQNRLLGEFDLREEFDPLAGLASCIEIPWTDLINQAYAYNTRVINVTIGTHHSTQKSCEYSTYAQNIKATQDEVLWIIASGNRNELDLEYRCSGEKFGFQRNFLVVSDDRGELTRGIHYADIVESALSYEQEDPDLKSEGTSLATPKVSAQAALLQAHFPQLKPIHLRWALIAGAALASEMEIQAKTSVTDSLEKKFRPYEVSSGGKANIIRSYKAAKYLDQRLSENSNKDITVQELLRALYPDDTEVEFRINWYKQAGLIPTRR